MHIATLFVALIAAAGLAIIAYGYRATSGLLLAAGDEEFLHVAEHTADQVRNLLAPARLLVELLARHPLTRTATLPARLEALPLLTTALVTHPEISAVYVGFGDGDFFLVRSLRAAVRQSLNAPAEAAFLVQSLAARDRPTPGRYVFLDRQLAVVRDDPRPDYRFDPRTREWYRQAVASATLVRTSPYVFFTTREIGTTLAQRSGTGGTVVGADITLQELSRHLAQSRVTPSAQIALVDRLGFVIAHPNPERLIRPGPGDPVLTRATDLEDPALRQLLTRPDDAMRGHTTLPIQGRAWIGGRRPIQVDVGEPLTLVLAAPRDELVAEARGLAQWQLVIGFGILGLTLGLVWLSARRISRPLEMLARSVERIGGGDLDTSLPEVWNPLEVGALRDVTDRMRRMLRGHIEERAARLAEEQRRARELDIARQIQESMLPIAPPEPLGGCYAIAATLQPAHEVGGDLYDFFLLDGRRLILAIADVADKGMPAALLMARVTGLLRAIGRGDTGPGEVLRELDMRLSQGNEMCMFVTMACAVLDGESGELRYASAGHERPLLRRLGGETTVLVLEGGPALGLGADAGFPVWAGHLAPGDTLVLCTDGVTEAFDRAGVAFGLERFRRVVAETPADALGTLPDRLVEAVERFSVGGAPRDDLAMLALQYRPPGVTVDAHEGESWRFSVDSEPETAARAWRWIEGILRARDVPPATVHDCVLAVEELLTNVVTHAYRGQPGHQAHIRLQSPAGEDRDPARGRRAAVQSARGAGAGPRGAARRPPGRGARPPAGQSPRRPLGVRARGSGQRRHAPLGAARRFPGGRGLRGRDTAWSGRDRRARDRDRQPRTDGALGGAPGAPRHRHRAPARGGARARARSTGHHVARVPARRPRVHQQRGHPVRHPRAQGDRGARGRVALVSAQAAVLKVLQIVKALPADQIFASHGGARRLPRHRRARGARAALTILPPERVRHVDGRAAARYREVTEPSPVHPLEDSAALLSDGPALAARMARDGYLYLPRLLPRDVIAGVQREVATVARDAGWLRRDAPLADAIADPSGFCVDPEPRYLEVLRRINRLESYHALKHHPRLLGFFERMLGAPVFPHPRVLMRNIFPDRLEYTTKAHQDYPNVQGTPEVYTAWMPLIDCPPELGGLQVARGSHTLGVLEFGIGNGAGGIEILDPLEDRWTGGPMQAGDVLVFHSHTVHKGVENRSDRLRMSIDCRFQRVRDPFNPDNANPDGQPLTWDEVYAGLALRRPPVLLDPLAPDRSAVRPDVVRPAGCPGLRARRRRRPSGALRPPAHRGPRPGPGQARARAAAARDARQRPGLRPRPPTDASASEARSAPLAAALD